jgi:hypothetical protein
MPGVTHCLNPHCEALILARRHVCSECWKLLPLELRSDLRTYESLAPGSDELEWAVQTAAHYLADRAPRLAV